MTTEPQCGSPSTAEWDTVKLGLVRPPLVYLIPLLVGILIQLTAPLPFLPRTLSRSLGAMLVAVAIALFSYSIMEFRGAGTPLPARKPTTVIVRTGPYRFSRNPIYLAFSLLRLGIAIWVSSLWLLATLAGALTLIHYVVIPREGGTWREDSVFNTWTTRRPCVAGCRPPNTAGAEFPVSLQRRTCRHTSNWKGAVRGSHL